MEGEEKEEEEEGGGRVALQRGHATWSPNVVPHGVTKLVPYGVANVFPNGATLA